jgi:hypothetical protein
MQVVGDYETDGYAHLRGLIPKDVAHAFMTKFKQASGGGAIPLSRAGLRAPVLKRPAFDVSGDYFEPMNFFLWGLTPIMSELVGRELLPTYTYFRIYREGDTCFVHSDRPSSEHGISLTLDYSDGEIWDLQIGKERIDSLYPLAEDFGAMDYASIGMEVGDAVLYQGSHYAHGRMSPNPNAWSAHLFLFYVDRDGPYREHAFDGKLDPARVNFSFV